MIIDAAFTSVWDGGFAVTTACKVNTETKEVFDIQENDDAADMFNNLDEEYITIEGNKHSVARKDERECADDYWYE